MLPMQLRARRRNFPTHFKRLDAAAERRLVTAVVKGLSMRQAVPRFGISDHTIAKIMNKHGYYLCWAKCHEGQIVSASPCRSFVRAHLRRRVSQDDAG